MLQKIVSVNNKFHDRKIQKRCYLHTGKQTLFARFAFLVIFGTVPIYPGHFLSEFLNFIIKRY